MSNDERIAILETTIHHIDASLTGITQELRRLAERIDHKFDKIEDKFNKIEEKIESKFDRIDQRFLEMDRKIDSNFKWLLGIMLGGFASTLGLIAHAVHWL